MGSASKASKASKSWTQKLGVFIDSSVSSNTLNWIKSLAVETLIRPASVAFPANDTHLRDVLNLLVTGKFDFVIFVTSAGLASFVERGARFLNRQRLVDSLRDIKVVAIGELVASRLRALEVEPAIQMSSDGDWKELLVRLDMYNPVTNVSIALERTIDFPGLSAGLEARGAEVTRLQPLAFKHKDPSAAEQDILDAIEDGELGTMLFPTPLSAARFAALVGSRKLPGVLRNSRQMVIVAIGLETEQVLLSRGIQCDITIQDPPLKSEIEQSMAAIRAGLEQSHLGLAGPASAPSARDAPWYHSLFLKAVRREPTEVTPVWLWKQTSRYLAEYQAIRKSISYIDLCRTPRLCSELTCLTVERLGVDAAVLFSDPWMMLQPMGFVLTYGFWPGPVVQNPLHGPQDLDRVHVVKTMESMPTVLENVVQTRFDLPDDLPLIGMANAPFSLVSRMIDGRFTRSFVQTKNFMYSHAAVWPRLMAKIVSSTIAVLQEQLRTGVQCVQLLDSHSGCLSIPDYQTFVWPYVKQITDAIAPQAPLIHVVPGNVLPFLSRQESLVQVYSVDWRIPLDWAWQTIGSQRAIQGNLDPAVLLSNYQQIRQRVQDILDQAGRRNGHIFNLGGSILPPTPVENVITVVDLVHQISQNRT